MHAKGTQRKGFQEKISLRGDRVSLITDLKAPVFPPKGAKTDRFTIILCTAGNGTVTMNGKTHSIGKNDMLTLIPGTAAERGSISDDFEACGFHLTAEFFSVMDSLPSSLWNARIHFAEHPVMRVSDGAAHIFTQYYDLIRSKFMAESPIHYHQTVTSLLMQAFMYEFHDFIAHCVEPGSVNFNSGDRIFRDFLELIVSSYPKPRSVTWYAEQLHVTPKYLSTICKSRCDSTASDIIAHFVVGDIKRSLTRPEKSIKEISNELGFPSLSFFGKYVRKHLGISPKAFRRQMTESL